MKRYWVYGCLLGVFRTASISASEVSDLNRNLPLEIEDARPAESGSLELQSSLRLDHTRDGNDEFGFEPQIQYGYSPRGHVQFTGAGKWGSSDHRNSGDTRLGALYRFVGDNESDFQSAVYWELQFPSGIQSAGLDAETAWIITQKLGSEGKLQAHLNGSWLHNSGPRDDEREDGYRVALGLSRKMSDSWVLIGDAVREVSKQVDDQKNLVEVGAMAQVGKNFITGLGLGAGLGEPSPEFRVTGALAYSIGSQ